MPEPTEPESLVSLFAELCRLKHARIQALLEAIGLYRGQPPVLRALWEQEGLTHTDIARRLGVQPATVTKMLQRMEKAGFLQRRPDPHDQRVSRVYLTDAGRAVRADLQDIWRRLDEEAFAGLDAEERDQLQRLFLHMRANLLHIAEQPERNPS